MAHLDRPLARPARAAGGPPSLARLFGCPLDAPSAAWVPPAGWKHYELPGLVVSIAVPPDWTLAITDGAATARAPGGTMRLILHRGRLVGRRRLDIVREALELSRLGPSYAGPACERRLDTHVAAAAGWRIVAIGYYARPLGGRRRSVALYAGLPGGDALIAILTAYWGRHVPGPDLALIRRVLGGITPILAASGAADSRAARSATAGSAGPP